MKIHTFSNGFRIIYEKPKTDIPLTSILGFVKVGSVDEPSHLKGASHFIEHMCFKGTKKIPKSYTIMNYYDRMGAFFNAFTEKEFTCYQVKCNETKLKDTIHILSDMMMNSIFKKEEFDKEYKVVIEENIKSEDDMENLISEKLEKILFEGSKYSDPVDTLSYHKKQMKYNDVVDFYHNYYHPENMVLSITTHIPFSIIKKIIQTSFFMEKKIKNIVKEIPIFIEPQNEIKYDILKKTNLSATYLSISFKTCPYENPDRYSLYMLSQIIGGTFSSYLFSILREKNGLTYSSECNVTFYKYSGYLSIDVVLDPKNIIKNGNKLGVIPLIIQLLNHLYKKGLSNDDFELIKGYIKGDFIIQSEDSLNQCEYNGKNLLLYKENFTPYDKIFEKHFLHIQKKHIESVIKKYFKKKNMCVCLLGSSLPSLNIIKKECENFIG
jgi:predicted Zn-dependent peptidase